MDNELIKIAKATPEVLKEIYGDLAKPGAQQAGKALATIIGLGNTILWPIALANEISKIALESNLEKFRNKLKNIPQEEICEVAPEVGVPVAEKLSYVTNEKLSEMYVELLTKASQKQTANMAHPSFVNIINSISPDEATLMNSIRKMPGTPFIETRLQHTNKNESRRLDPMFAGVSCLSDLHYPKNVCAYVSNLSGLGILEVRKDIYMVGENIYEPLESYQKSLYTSYKFPPEEEIVFVRGKIETTEFGKLLMQACFQK